MKKQMLFVLLLLLALGDLTGCAYRDYYHHPRHQHKYYPHRNLYGGWYSKHGNSR